jgi:ataxia telangiectasia mutated family protein
VYQEVCQHFKPVLRFFFLEHFKDPDSWLSRKISYSRSVAASSMIGHVLGLGDRHGQNILLDKQTGEVVHIDLGVAFEQVP